MAKLEGITVEINGDATGLNSALKDTNNQLSSTQSELNQVNKLLKLDPSNTTLLAQKQELLSKAVNGTSEKLETLKKAQEQANKSGLTNTEEGQKAYRELQREIASTELTMEKLEKQSRETNNQIDNANNGTTSLGNSTEKMAGKMNIANIAVTGLVAGIKAIATASIAAVSGIAGMAVSAGKYADDINTLNAQTGIATDQLQIYQRAAELVDVDVNTIAGSMAKLTKNMATASKGTGDVYAAFNKLGISVTDANGTLRNNKDVFSEAIKSLSQIEDETQRDAIAMQIFGKSAQQLNPLIKGGIDTLDQLGEEWTNLGIILDQDTLDGANAFNDQIDILKANASGIFNALGSEIAASLVPAMENFNKVASETMGSLLKAFREGGIEGLVDEAGNVLGEILAKITEYLPQVIDMGITLLQSLLDGLTNNLPAITEAIVKIVVSLTNGLLQMLPQLVEIGLVIIENLATGIGNALPELIPAIIDTILLIVDVLINHIDDIVQAGIDILIGLIDGIVNAIPVLIDRIPIIIESIITALADNIDVVIEGGIMLLLAIIEGLIVAIPQLVKAIPQIINALINGLRSAFSKMMDVGKYLIEGLWQGILNAKDWLLNKIKSFASSITDGIKSFFGINSPSIVFRDEVGKYLAQGIGVGFEKEMPNTISDMAKSLADMTNDLAADLSIDAMPSVNKAITSQNFYNTKNYQATTEVVRQPSEVTIVLDKTKLGKVMIPVLDREQTILGGTLA